MKRIINGLLIAIRPATLLAGIGPVILGLALTYSNSGIINSPFVALLTLFSTIFMQIGTNLVNDYFDQKDGIDNDLRLGPKRVSKEGLLNLKEVKIAYRLSLLISFLMGIYLMIHGGIVIIILGLLSLIAAYCYTAGPFPLSRNALGELAAFIFFGPVAVCGTFYLQNSFIDSKTILFSIIPGFISAAIMSINNLRDRDSDKNVNKKTIAVLTSESFSKKLPVLFVTLSIIPSIYSLIFYQLYLFIIPITLPLLFVNNWKQILTRPISADLNNNLKLTGKFLFLSCVINSIILCL